MANSIKSLSVIKLKEMFKNYPLYSQENVKDKVVILEMFIPYQNIYWLITEGSCEEDDFIFFGYNRIIDEEYGYVSFKELYDLEYDIRFIYYKEPILLDKIKNKYSNIK